MRNFHVKLTKIIIIITNSEIKSTNEDKDPLTTIDCDNVYLITFKFLSNKNYLSTVLRTLCYFNPL